MKLLEEGEVAVSPGSGFGPAGEGYLRLALVENENRLRQAVRQIGRCLRPKHQDHKHANIKQNAQSPNEQWPSGVKRS